MVRQRSAVMIGAVIAATVIACAALSGAWAAEGIFRGLVLAQTSMGSSSKSPPPSSEPAPPPLNLPVQSAPPLNLPVQSAPPLNLPAQSPPPLNLPAPSTPKADYIPPGLAPAPPNQQASVWGAIGFTADGSYSSDWKAPSKAEAEAEVAKSCAAFGRGSCEVVSFSGQECAALATFIGSYRGQRWSLSFTDGGNTYPEAQTAAMDRCNSDERTQGNCQLRMAACADGR
jgi:hypothetical protein